MIEIPVAIYSNSAGIKIEGFQPSRYTWRMTNATATSGDRPKNNVFAQLSFFDVFITLIPRKAMLYCHR